MQAAGAEQHQHAFNPSNESGSGIHSPLFTHCALRQNTNQLSYRNTRRFCVSAVGPLSAQRAVLMATNLSHRAVCSERSDPTSALSPFVCKGKGFFFFLNSHFDSLTLWKNERTKSHETTLFRVKETTTSTGRPVLVPLELPLLVRVVLLAASVLK